MNTNDTNTFFEYATYDEFRRERLVLNHESALNLWYSLPAGLPTLANSLVRRQTPKEQRSRLRKMKFFAFYCTLLRKTFLRKRIHGKGTPEIHSFSTHSKCTIVGATDFDQVTENDRLKSRLDAEGGELFVYCTWATNVESDREVVLHVVKEGKLWSVLGFRLWNDALNVPSLKDESLYGIYQSLGQITVKFLHKGANYDPSISHDELFKAGRTVWFMIAFQMQLNLPLTLTDSIFGYNMLYPYTDDLVDCNEVTREAKKDFAKLFHERLLVGETTGGSKCQFNGQKSNSDDLQLPASLREHADRVVKIFDMVKFIENDWSRGGKYQGVYMGLATIHESQMKSTLQHARSEDGYAPTMEQIEEVSAEKGGASLIAAGYLIEGRLTRSKMAYLEYLGFGLQLLDDLQVSPRNGQASWSGNSFRMFEKIWRTIIAQSLHNHLPKDANWMSPRHVSFSTVIVPRLTNALRMINALYQIERLASPSPTTFACLWWCSPCCWFSKRPLACKSIIPQNSIVISLLSVLSHSVSCDQRAWKKEFGPSYGTNGFDKLNFVIYLGRSFFMCSYHTATIDNKRIMSEGDILSSLNPCPAIHLCVVTGFPRVRTDLFFPNRTEPVERQVEMRSSRPDHRHSSLLRFKHILRLIPSRLCFRMWRILPVRKRNRRWNTWHSFLHCWLV